MAYLPRNIDVDLLKWKASPRRKPLIVRGARQVGKSRTIRHLGESFQYYLEINLEAEKDLCRLFEEIPDVKELSQRLGAVHNVKIIPGETLLFIDEIQNCPAALKSLWFFKENYPELHVVAAGSLLEFALNEMPSYGVGRVRSMFMYPMSFKEFLMATGKEMWIKEIETADWTSPLEESLHSRLVSEFRSFLMVGGMPASVAAWVETQDYSACQDEQNDIQQSYYDDFAKYAKKVDPQLLRNTLSGVVRQSGQKFVYSRVEGGYKSEEVKEALRLLRDAGIIIPVQMSAANGLPLGAQVNPKFTRYDYLDTGLLLRVLAMNYDDDMELTRLILAGEAPNLVNKGLVAELTAGLELIKSSNPQSRYDLFYWENLDRNATSEVEYIIAKNARCLPIEVKAGTSGKMKSLRLFMNKKKLTSGIRSSLENFGMLKISDTDDKGKNIMRVIGILPLYAIWRLPELPLPE
ncbi:MAG: AAA family ATPase [Muribaculaceae bacterium]|nr:AAA family ATPase [Muribaculaceae bacterium]